MNQQTGKYLVVAGLLMVVTGLFVYFFHNKLYWFGKLPGDIRVERPNFKIYFPITTMLLMSLLISILLNIFRRL